MAPLKISLSYLGETPKIDEESGFFFSQMRYIPCL